MADDRPPGRERRTALQPTGLMCELLAHPERTTIRNPRPRFSWIVNDLEPNASQVAARVLVASSLEGLDRDEGDLWDSGAPETRRGWVTDDRSVDVVYAGSPLASMRSYHWKVKTWNGVGNESPWSEPQTFRTGELAEGHVTATYPLETRRVGPVAVVATAPGTVFADFGRAAFGTVEVDLACSEARTVEVRLGEVLAGPCRIDPEPGGARRFRSIGMRTEPGRRTYRLAIPPDGRNTGKAAILMPAEVGEVLPFRYCELRGLPGPVGRGDIRRVEVSYPFDDGAASFVSSNRILDAVWELCRYSMRATSFCGIYVDGDRERIPYEADAYINQLGHYCCDRELTMARATHEYLLLHPTWPTEWLMHSVLIAWADYLHSGNPASMARYYDDLVAKSLVDLERGDGLISTSGAAANTDLVRRLHLDHDRYIFERRIDDLVDWPQRERDGHVLLPVSAVSNAFHYRSLVLMGRIARALGKAEDASRFAERAAATWRSFNEDLYDPRSGLYLDGEGAEHSSLHANLFPLAFGLVPPERVAPVTAFLRRKGMACSVYAAQFLLEALYRAGEAEHALALLTSTGERGWAHMIDVGSTISLEAWDDRFKPNQDWNHAWGAAPANIIPRRLMGVRPLEPGFAKILVQPQPGSLSFASLALPTVRGTVRVRLEQSAAGRFRLEVEVPGNTTARVAVPRPPDADCAVSVDGRRLFGTPEGGFLFVDGVGSGLHVIER